jgi:DNA-binding transcriptional LysR family regulator
VELRHLRYFVAVADERHFGRAAARLYVAQSTLSQQIKLLERELGARLLERGARSVELTGAGAALLEHARALLASADAAVAAVRQQATGQAGTLTVGLFENAAAELTPAILQAFRAARPLASLRLEQLGPVDMEDAVARGRVDVALLRLPVTDERLAVTPLFREPRVVLLASAHRLANADVLHVGDVLDEPFLVADDQAPRAWRFHMQAVDDRNGVLPRVGRAGIANLAELMMAASAGEGVTLMPASGGRATPYPSVRHVPLVGTAGSVVAMAARRDDPNPLVACFRDTARSVTVDLVHVVPGASLQSVTPAAQSAPVASATQSLLS